MEKIFEGKTEQEAVELAAREFGVSREYMDVEVIKKSKKGIFGLNSKVVIKVSVEGLPRGDDEDEDFIQSESYRQEAHQKRNLKEGEEDETLIPLSDEMKEIAKEIIIKLINKLGIEVNDVIFSEDSPYIEIEVKEEHQNILIGRFGKNLEALQLLVNAMLQSKTQNMLRVVLDIEQYRKKRTDWLRAVASEKARYVLSSRKSFLMNSFGPYDRRQIHTAIRLIDGVQTVSEGDGYLKRVRIFLA